jgi:hypothetical protein
MLREMRKNHRKIKIKEKNCGRLLSNHKKYMFSSNKKINKENRILTQKYIFSHDFKSLEFLKILILIILIFYSNNYVVNKKDIFH